MIDILTGTIANLLSGITLSKLFKNEKLNKNNSENKIIVKNSTNTNIHVGDITNNIQPPEDPKKYSNLTPSSIEEGLNKLSEYQKIEGVKAYEGLQIKWKLKFHSLSIKENDQVLIMTYHENNHLVSFEANLKNYPFLKTLHKGDQITTIGTIKEISTLYIDIKTDKIEHIIK